MSGARPPRQSLRPSVLPRSCGLPPAPPACVMRRGGMIGDRGVSFGRPVARRVAGAGADEQRGPSVARRCHGRTRARSAASAMSQCAAPGLDAAGTTNPMNESSTCSDGFGAMRAFVNSHCSSRARCRSKPSLIGASTRRLTRLARKDNCRSSSRSKRRPREQRAQAPQLPQGCGLIEGDKLDFRENRRHQLGFELADDPGKPRLRPRRLEGSKRRQRMAGIADRRQTQQAHVLQRRFET